MAPSRRARRLDNATESVLTEQDPEKRLIRVAVYAQNGFVMLRFENYCAQPVELGPDGCRARAATAAMPKKRPRRRDPRRHRDPALGERVVHPAGTAAAKE